MNLPKHLLACLALGVAPSAADAQPQARPASSARVVRVRNADELRRAVGQAAAGTRIEVAPGTYEGAFFFSHVRGAQKRPIVIAGAIASRPPVFKGSLQFSEVAHLTLQDIAIEESAGNGLNMDDGDFDLSARGITLRRVRVSNGRGEGNLDGIKLSGLENFRVENCTVERWGTAGSGIDMVGCRNGVIEGCRLLGRGEPGKADGVQAKGGSRNITIRRCRFVDAGSRGINVGGSTDAGVFRPPLSRWYKNSPLFEAQNITIEGNTFSGGQAPLAFVGVDGALARFNTIYKPLRWAMRILQETTSPGFAPCRNVRFESNLVVWDAANWIEGGVNIGPDTEPKSFRFRDNWWFCADKPQASRPALPTVESGGVYGRDPLFVDTAGGDFRLKAASPARKAGASAFRM